MVKISNGNQYISSGSLEKAFRSVAHELEMYRILQLELHKKFGGFISISDYNSITILTSNREHRRYDSFQDALEALIKDDVSDPS